MVARPRVGVALGAGLPRPLGRQRADGGHRPARPRRRARRLPGLEEGRTGGGIVSAAAMSLSSSVARPLLAGMFIYGGLDSVRHAEGKVPAANKVVAPIGDASGGRIRTVHLVQVNGAAQVLAGAALATGRF